MKTTMFSSAFVVAFCLLTVASTAQLDLANFLPSACQQKAVEGFEGADDAAVVSIFSVGTEIPIGEDRVDISIDMTTGEAPLWVYSVYSPKLDSLINVPFIQLLTLCNALPVPPGDAGEVVENVSLVPVPDDYNEGTRLMGHITSDPDYIEWAKVFPDSVPRLVIMATSEETFFDFPANTPFWVMQWISSDDEGAFVCISHAESGETFCFGPPPTSVAAAAAKSGFRAVPNPASDDVILTVPNSWIGTKANIQMVDVTGRAVVIADNQMLSSPQVLFSVSGQATGLWSIRLSNGHAMQTIPLSIVR